jgi:hypothetical protein
METSRKPTPRAKLPKSFAFMRTSNRWAIGLTYIGIQQKGQALQWQRGRQG